MSDFAGGPDDSRPRSPSSGRGGRFDDGGRRSPPISDRWGPGIDRGVGHPPGPAYRARSPDYARKRRRDDSPPSRDRYIPNYERESYRDRERRDHLHSLHDHDRSIHNTRHGPSPEMFDDPYRRSGSAYRDEPFGYSPERGMPGRGGPNHSRSHLTPPSELPHLVSFRYFADFMRSTSPHIAEDKNKLAEQWKHYRQDHTRKQLVTFFEENKSKPWFREKYQPGPEFEELRERLKKKGRDGKVEAFTQRLEKGELDIINYDYLPLSKKFSASKPPADTSEAQTPNGVKGENPAGLPFATVSTEDCEAKPSSSVAKDEETETLMPESEVKVTLTQPDNDIKMERPSIATDPEAEEFEDPDDEFSASMAEAMTGPNSGLAPSSMLGSLIGENIKGKTGTDDVVILLPSERQLFIKSISPDISRVELENHCKQAEGFDYLALSDPHTGKKLHRVGWVSFLPETDMKAAENTLSESKINNFTLHMMKTDRPAFQKLRMCPGIMNTPDRISRDLAQIRKLVTQFENEYFGVGACEDKRGSMAIEAKIKQIKEMSEMNEESVLPKAEVSESHTPELGAVETEPEAKLVVRENKNPQTEKKALDLYLYYLRTVFNCCYYCVCVCDFQEELLRRCAKHVRRPAPAMADDGMNTSTPQSHRRNAQGVGQKANEASWARTLDERLSLLLARSDVDPREFGGERIDDEIHRLCQPQITDEGAGKFRCKNCSKLFKAMNFIEKHIMTKHGEVINQDSIERIKYLNNYVLDPSHTPPQPPPVPDYSNLRPNNGLPGGMAPSHGMMPNMGSIANSEFHNGGYPPMMNNPMAGPGSMMIGGPYGGYPPPMYAAYPSHPYPPMAGPPPMFANGPMMNGPPGGGGGPPGGYGTYYMNAMGPAPGYPPPFQPPHHQVYSSLPAIPPMPQGRVGNGSSRRLGDRISRNFADDSFMSVPPHEAKRTRREDQQNLGGRANVGRGGPGGGGAAGAEVVASDPRSKTVLAYNDLDTPAGDEVVLNY